MTSTPNGYAGRLLRVDLSTGARSDEVPDATTLRRYIGGTGLGMTYLYDEVAPGTGWDAPGNRLIFATGPLGGTRVNGSGSFSVVTKGPLTNGATSTQANGFLGAFLKFSGFDGIIVQGAATAPTYLHVHDGQAELRDARHLAGKDTWETEEAIRRELGKSDREMSVFGIGPAGEHRVKFASIAGGRGHVAGHNGAGAVMGAKNLKAIAVARGTTRFAVADPARLGFLAKDLYEKVTGPGGPGQRMAKFGTTGDLATCKGRLLAATLPVMNYTTSIFPRHVDFCREHVDPMFEIEGSACWACKFDHCRILTVKSGPYAGYVGEEPEYEGWAHWGPTVGQKDPVHAFVLGNEVDRLGMESNHAGWLIAWLMECYEKELIGRDALDGLELRWGATEAARTLLRRIAAREGVGDVLANGIAEATEHFPPETRGLAIYTKKGNTPRAHDHRAYWRMLLDTCVSDTGTDAAGTIVSRPQDVGLSVDADVFSPEVNARIVAGSIDRMPIDDCLGMCRFNNRGPGVTMDYLAEMLKAATGFDYTGAEVSKAGYRVVNLLRAFNVRHGLTADLDAPSPRYGSAPIDGPFQGVTVGPVWAEMREHYYRLMGWDTKTGKPLESTLRGLDLGHTVRDVC